MSLLPGLMQKRIAACCRGGNDESWCPDKAEQEKDSKEISSSSFQVRENQLI